ncbi:neprilysin-2-like [Tigriopus californicus]|uniref:neprilysin-2-like n=1 Tax=Tigriopus californicus TaxID=6832 RepID=UPI0027DA8763|nr:neprilysin-2-like [Tigriopus californicus]
MGRIRLIFLWFVVVDKSFCATIPLGDEDVHKELCLTKTCIQLTSQLFDNMNLNADPCHDFYEFTCGNFVRTKEIPEHKGLVDGFERVNNLFEQQGKALLEKEQSEGDWEIFKHFRTHYKACMNESAIEEKSLTLIKTKLESLGGWPILKGEDWSDEDFYLEDYLVTAIQEGFRSFSLFEISVEIDEKTNDSHVIKLDQAMFGISREFLAQGRQERTVQAYRKYMNETAQHFGVKSENLDELDKVLDLEIELAGIALSRENRSNPILRYNEFIAEEIPSTIVPSWPQLMQKIFQNETITGEEKVVIKDLDYFRNLESVLEGYSRRNLANFLGWTMIKNLDSYLDSFILDKKQELEAILKGKKSQPLRWKRCVKAVGFNNYDPKSFQIGVGSMHVLEYFPPKAKEIVEDMLRRIRATFSDLIVNSNWMDDATIGEAQAKLDRMDQMIGYPDELLDEEKVTSLYEGLEVSDDQYLQNHLTATKIYDKIKRQRLRKPASEFKWTSMSTSALVNALYEWEINAMLFNAAFLQDVFFQTEAPMYKNYGAVGVAIGHEITHGFDNSGRKFDLDGKLRNWWTNDTDKAFDVKKECLVDLYEGFEVKQVGKNVNGRLTLGENIADFGGVRSSHMAFEKYLTENNETQVLPGLPFTPLQLYWIFFGQSWCTVARDEKIRDNLLNDDHSPPQFRINGPLSNYEGFAKDFGCKPSDQMVQETQCRIW